MTRRSRWFLYLLGGIGLVLGLVALMDARRAQARLTDVREEMLIVIQGLRTNDLRALSGRLETMRTDLSTLQSDVRGWSTAMKGVEAKLGQVDQSLAGLMRRVEENEQGLRTASRALDSLRTDLAQLRVAFAAPPPEIELRLREIERQLGEMQVALAIAAARPRIGVVDAEALLARIFLSQTASERDLLRTKTEAMRELWGQYAQGEVRGDAYLKRYALLQAEYLQAKVEMTRAMLNKMIASPAFTRWQRDLEVLEQEVHSLSDQGQALVRQAQSVIINYTAFFEGLQTLQAALCHVDRALAATALAKIREIAHEVGLEQGYDLVFHAKDGVMYSPPSAITDLTPEVEKRLGQIFP